MNDRLAAAVKPQYDRFKVVLDFRTLADYFARLEKNRPAINVGTFVGAGRLRGYVIGESQRAATAAKEGGFLGFRAELVSEREQLMLDRLAEVFHSD